MSFFFFNDTATTEIYTLSRHDPLPILIAVDSGAPATLTIGPGITAHGKTGLIGSAYMPYSNIGIGDVSTPHTGIIHTPACATNKVGIFLDPKSGTLTHQVTTHTTPCEC